MDKVVTETMRKVAGFCINRPFEILLRGLLSRNQSEKLATWFCQRCGFDPLMLGYRNMGILKWESLESSGEEFVLRKILPQLLPAQPTLFDVGANRGDYATLLRTLYNDSKIYAFEPNPDTYVILKERAVQCGFTATQVGLGEAARTTTMWTDSEDKASGHASLFFDAFGARHPASAAEPRSVELTTLDSFCEQHAIERIDFLKIDTEGNELNVLRGAERLISNGGLRVVQFEFNDMNVASRAFLKDFYAALPSYAFYRLDTSRLIPLGTYTPRNEIFVFQNIIAIPNDDACKLPIKITASRISGV